MATVARAMTDCFNADGRAKRKLQRRNAIKLNVIANSCAKQRKLHANWSFVEHDNKTNYYYLFF